MAKYQAQEITDKRLWEEFLLSRNPQSFLQSWNWGETNAKLGKKIIRLGFFEGKKLVGLCLFVKEEARRGRHLVVAGGPIIDWKKPGLVTFVLTKVKEVGRSEGAWFVRVRPELPAAAESRRIFQGHGFVDAPMHLHAEHTWVLDISLPEEAVLAGMRKNTRYLVRRSLKEGLTLKKTKDPKAADLLFALQEETIARHKFVGFSKALFKSEIESFGQDNQALVFSCFKGRVALSAAIIIFYGNCGYYHFSGSTTKYPKLPHSYFLQWQVILEAKKRGLNHYNFWGIAPNDDPNHRFAGVTLFKKGFGGQRLDSLHAQDLPLSRVYWATYVFETLRRQRRSL